MIDNNLNVEYLGQREIAGEDTANPMIQWMKHLQLASEYLTKSPNGNGSLTIDLDFELLCARILQRAATMAGEFRGTVQGSRLTMASGHIYVGGNTYSVGQHSKSLSGSDDGKGWMAEITSGGISVSWGAAPNTAVTSTTLTVPLCGAVKSGGRWVPYQWALGSVVMAMPPAFLISGYDASKTQSLDQVGGTLVWRSYKQCQ